MWLGDESARLKIIMSGNGFVPVYVLKQFQMLISRFDSQYAPADDYLVRKAPSEPLILAENQTSLGFFLDESE